MDSTDIQLNERIADALVEDGYCILHDFVSPDLMQDMVAELEALHASNDTHRAGVGQGAELTSNPTVRGDFIHWVENGSASNACYVPYLNRLESLKTSLNRHLSLGLFEFEGHYALYPSGSFYRKHLDQFQHDSHRTLTCILYLNQDWNARDGGQLRIYLDDNNPELFLDVNPVSGTFVTFLSSRFWHEVLPAKRERMSLTGWYKTRSDNPF